MTVYISGTTGYSGPVGVLGDLTTTGNTILGDQSTDTLNVANGNLVLNSSGNAGLGVTPSAWSSSYKAFEQVGGSVWSINAQNILLSQNSYNNGTNDIYKTSNRATQYQQSNGQHFWFNAASGTAGNPITFTQAMTLDTSGRLGVGRTSVGAQLDVLGAASTSAMRVVGNSGASIYVDLSGGGDNYYDATNNIFRNASGTERARIDTSGNFLVGTSTAEARLTIGGTAASAANTTICRIGNTDYTTSTVLSVAPGVVNFDAPGVVGGRMRLDSSGNLGIGNSSPGAKLDVTGPNTDGVVIGVTGNSTNGSLMQFNQPGVANRRWGIPAGSDAFIWTGFNSGAYSVQMRLDASGSLYVGGTTGAFGGSQKGVSAQSGSVITVLNGESDQSVGSTGTVSNHAFSFKTNGLERARITSGGDTVINGYLTATNRLYANTGIQLSGTFYLAGSGGTYDAPTTGYRFSESFGMLFTSGGSVWHHQLSNSSYIAGFGAGGANYGSGNCYLTGTLSQNYSDIRLKNDLGTIENALDKVMTLRGFRYTINQLGVDLGFNNVGVEAGLSAQDVKAVLPEAVMLAGSDMAPGENGETISKSGENYLTLRYDRVVPLLVNAIKELKSELDSVKTELAALKGN
jgi:hypothetical protein